MSKKSAATAVKHMDDFDNLTTAKGMAQALFDCAAPTGEMVFGVHDRVFGDPETDEEERNAIIADLALARAKAVDLFGKPTVEDVFGVYDRCYTDLLDGDED